MLSPEEQLLPPPVTALRQRIEHWRSSRTKKGPMPRDLWEEAALLARQRGIYAISSALRLNYDALKGWSEDSPKKRRRAAPRKATTGQTFVRLDPLPGISSPSPAVEVEMPGGAKMTIRLSSVNAMDAVALLGAFMRDRR